MSSGSGLFRRPSAIPIFPISQPQSSTTADETPEPRRRHGSAPLTTALGLARRGSASASTSSATASRRSCVLELPPPRKSSEPGTVHKPSPLSPKRKPLPKGSAFEKQNSSQDDQVNNKLAKMELTNGSTMVCL
jgi:hypothetical protein